MDEFLSPNIPPSFLYMFCAAVICAPIAYSHLDLLLITGPRYFNGLV